MSQIAAAEIEMTMLIRRRMNVPTRAFRALSNILERANDREIAVLIQISNRMIIGPGLIEMIYK